MGFVNLADGIGRQSPELVDAFRKELDVSFKYTRKIKRAKTPKYMKKLAADTTSKWGKVIFFEDVLWSPSEGSMVGKLHDCPKDTIKIAYSMYEATKIPKEWVDILNTTFDAVAVPSNFLIDVYQNSGVLIPVFEVPLGLNMKRFLAEPLKEKRGEKLVFGNLSAGSDRKNHETLIRAFGKAFGDDPSVKLRINVRYADKEIRNEITKAIAELDLNNIEFTQKSLSRSEYVAKFKEIDCYVSPSKGEGFSIQPREAMALGIPVIATNNTGQIPVCESGLVEIVNSPIKKIAEGPWGDYYGHNFDCSIDELADAMKKVKSNYDHYLGIGEKARAWASQFQYSELKPLYRMLISPKEIVLGDANVVTNDRIVTNSKRLFNKYRKIFGKDICRVSGNESVFTNIYKTAEWGRNEKGEGCSGLGSTVENAKPYTSYLAKFIEQHNIKSVVDLGCGDWSFSRHFNWDNIQYTGVDVVKYIIRRNQKQFSAPNIRFVHADVATYELPEADLLVCKDVMQHMSSGDIHKVLSQFSKFKYCLLTNDVYDPLIVADINGEINSGGLRPLDLTKAPFYLEGEKALEYDAHGNKKVILLVQGKR